ncbi:unnamed protein product [Laminaria digitata]
MGSRLAFGSALKFSQHHSPALPLCTARCVLPVATKSRVGMSHAPLMTMTTPQTTPQVCTLDCTDTIMKVKGSIPRLYLGVLEDRLGVQEGALPGVSEQDLLDSFGTSMKKRSREVPCFGYGVMSSEEWWGVVVRDTFRGAGVAEESLQGVFDEVFDELYHNVFTSLPTWELVPGAKDVIRDLRAWCRQDGGPLALGVVSNFDERLHPLLKNLGVYESFDFVLTSRECGSEKPDSHMFREALKRAGASEGSKGVHIGDRFSKDVLGARRAGWDAVLITGKPIREEEKGVEHVRVGDLISVPGALGLVVGR